MEIDQSAGKTFHIQVHIPGTLFPERLFKERNIVIEGKLIQKKPNDV
jgi:hypothetical protein